MKCKKFSCAGASVMAIESLGKEVYKIRKFINTCL